MTSIANKPSKKSIYALSFLVFLIADVQGGAGPYISVYLKAVLDWDLGRIGLVLAMYNIASLVAQIPSGFMIDRITSKRLLIGVATVMIAFGFMLIVNSEHLVPLLIAQCIIGVAASIIPPAIAAVTLGLVGRKKFPPRLALNGTFNHAGNVFNALMTGVLTLWLGVTWILYTDFFFSLLSLVPLLLINPCEIDNEVAREAPEGDSSINCSIKKLLTTPKIIVFGIAVALFTLANAIQLPLLGQKLALISPQYASPYMAISIVLAQSAMIVVTYCLSFIIDKIGRKPLFSLSYLILMIRAILYTLFDNPYALLANQILDGVAVGIFSVFSIVITADLAKDTGRFNFMQGITIFCISIGSAISNIVGGLVAKYYSIDTSFWMLAFIALLGAIFYVIFMPETKDEPLVN